MAIAFMINRLKALFLLVIGIIKRGLCCFRRRRRPSGELIPLTTVGVVPNNYVSLEDRGGQDLQSWNSWDDNPVSIVTERTQENPVQQKIDLYRQQAMRSISESEDQPQPDFFESPDLGTWEENPGWEDQTQEDWDPDVVLKEKRRLERQQRMAEQQQKRQEREQHKMSRPVALGARLS
ncbi:hypothetical protein C0J52_28039 [Blattella germanica]|nr:hypothetical protein C0J52_28039 [Blattella germanica]